MDSGVRQNDKNDINQSFHSIDFLLKGPQGPFIIGLMRSWSGICSISVNSYVEHECANNQEEMMHQLKYFTIILAAAFVTGVQAESGETQKAPVDDSIRTEEQHKLRAIGIEKDMIVTNFKEMDADKNKYISKKEAADHNASRYFSMMDRNSDERISADEFAQFMHKYPYVIKVEEEAE